MKIEAVSRSSDVQREVAASSTELTELQALCAEYAASGSELGEVASEISRISTELGRLCAIADDFLAS
ncbi:hypothetical protein [Methyloligella halotolerans]|uniref:hypothetical protein n=1 Tax=Methyloligella halotolerans TaxID=1177755 RepID=UPI00083E62FF|nr:hypothetical protein [Methyloligella halotolerans]